MAHNFIEQLNLISDPSGNIPLSNTQFFSSDGNDLNAGTDPNLPKQNLNAVTSSTMNAVIGGDSTLQELPNKSTMVYGDGVVVVDGQGIRPLPGIASFIGFKNIYLRNFTPSIILTNDLYPIYESILEENVGMVIQDFGVGLEITKNMFVKDQDLTLNAFPNATSVVRPWIYSVFYSGGAKKTLTIDSSASSEPNPYREFHSNVFINQEIVCEQGHIDLMSNCYFETCSFIIGGTPYADLVSLQGAVPTACPNAQTTGASFKGSLDKLEFRSVETTSTLLGNGKQGANIGGVNEGLVFNELNVQSSTNITFSGGDITLTNPLLDGQIIWEDSFSKVVTNPFLRLNGVPDFVNNIIRSVQVPDPINPRKTTVEIETKDKTTPYEPIQIYRTGYEIGQDAFGIYSGEDDYHEFGLQELRVFGVRITLTVLA